MEGRTQEPQSRDLTPSHGRRLSANRQWGQEELCTPKPRQWPESEAPLLDFPQLHSVTCRSKGHFFK